MLLFPITSLASEITLKVDKSELDLGESIHITGTSEIEEDIVMKIVGPNDTVYYLDVLPVNEGNYETTVGFSSDRVQASPGEYQIIAGSEEVHATASFSIKGADDENNGGNDNGNEDDEENPDDGTGNEDVDDGKNDSGNEDSDQDNDKDGNTDNEGNNGNDGDDVNNGDNKDDNDAANEDKSSEKPSDEQLPNTSTMNYNYLLIGAILLCLGITGLVIYQRRKRMQG